MSATTYTKIQGKIGAENHIPLLPRQLLIPRGQGATIHNNNNNIR